jgi:hypothetical protein
VNRVHFGFGLHEATGPVCLADYVSTAHRLDLAVDYDTEPVRRCRHTSSWLPRQH